MTEQLNALENVAIKKGPGLVEKIGFFFFGQTIKPYLDRKKQEREQKEELKQAQTPEGLARNGYTVLAPKNIDNKKIEQEDDKKNKEYSKNNKGGKKLGKKQANNIDDTTKETYESYEDSQQLLKGLYEERKSRKPGRS